jgi:thiol-disulfide isomerase/thioredoxin
VRPILRLPDARSRSASLASPFAALALLCGLALLSLSPAAAEDGGPPEAAPGSLRSGSVRDFALEDLGGRTHRLAEYRDAKAIVLAWTAPGCPLSRLYAPRLERLAKDLAPRGVVFLGVDSNAHEDLDALRADVARAGWTFPVLLDAAGTLAQRVGAGTSTTVAVLDENRAVRYVGAVDDQHGIGGGKPEPTRRFLEEAVAACLERREVATPRTDAPGCAISFDEAPKAKTSATWHADVAPLVEARCATCHRPGQVGPFPLLSYRDVRSRRAVVREVVAEGRMPPWHADAPRGVFENDLRLGDDEKALLLSWLDAGAPEGAAPATPRPPPPSDGWALGTPDAVVRFDEAQAIPAEGVVRYRYVEVPTDFPEDRWVRATEVRPGDPSVVHHALVAVLPPGSRSRSVFEPTRGFFSVMVPGRRPIVYPEGTAKRLPKGATLLFQMHYTPNGVATTDRTSLGLWFTGEPSKEVRTVGVYQPRLRIPPGASAHEVAAIVPVLFDAHVLAWMPHMHVRGKAFRYEVGTLGKDDVKVVFSVPRYDFNWQAPYRLKEPMPVKKGSFLRAVGTFDNSAENPYNPDPTKEVRWGEQTFEEMMIGYVDYTVD